MNQTEKNVIEILKEVFSGRPAEISRNIDSDAVCKEMISQSVYTIAYSWLKDHNYTHSKSLSSGAEAQQILRQTSKWFYMMDEQQNLVELLTNAGHSFAVMKGSANAALYPVPELRKSGDIDLLVRAEEYDAIRKELIQNGYSLKGDLDPGKHHYEMTKKGIIVEVHKRPGGIYREETENNRILIDYFQEGLNTIEWVKLYDYSFPVLPKPHNGLMLLLHTAQHMSTTGIGLRHLLDWAVFADRYLTDEFWKSDFESVAKRANLDVLAQVLTRTCELYLGLNGELNWCKCADQKLCDETIEYFIEQGEFGNKSKDRVSRIIVENRTLIDFLKYFDQSSLYSLPLASKFPLLRPVAWIYQLLRYVRYVVKMIMNKKPYSTMNQSISAGIHKRDLLDRLKINV